MPFGVHIGSCSTSCHRRPSPPCCQTRDEVLTKAELPGLAPGCKSRGCNEATKQGAAADAAAEAAEAAAAEEAEAAEAAEAEPYCTSRSFKGTKTH